MKKGIYKVECGFCGRILDVNLRHLNGGLRGHTGGKATTKGMRSDTKFCDKICCEKYYKIWKRGYLIGRKTEREKVIKNENK